VPLKGLGHTLTLDRLTATEAARVVGDGLETVYDAHPLERGEISKDRPRWVCGML
jgi:hypothetical protein